MDDYSSNEELMYLANDVQELAVVADSPEHIGVDDMVEDDVILADVQVT